MIVSSEADLLALKAIGRVVALTIATMGRALEPGITTAELDAIGRKTIEDVGARPAPELVYGFPGATCISVNEEVAKGVPGSRVIAAGDLVNIDVCAELDGFFSDSAAPFAVPPVAAPVQRLVRDGRCFHRACIDQVRVGAPYARIGETMSKLATEGGYTLIEGLFSHHIGRELHERPFITTWANPADDGRTMVEGVVFTIEPFLSLGALLTYVDPARYFGPTGDEWTLVSHPRAPTVHYEHTVVATRNGPLVLTELLEG
jgi:methionyl aminopeptidase